MRTNKFFAILLAGMMILAMLSGTTVALATENTPEPVPETVGAEPAVTPAVTIEAPVVIVTETPVVPGTPEPTGSTSKPEATEDPTTAPADPTDAPADPTEAPADPTDAPADPTDAPADPTDAPVAYSDCYATVKGGTAVYGEKALKTLLGEFTEDQLIYIADVTALDSGAIYEAHFDTDDTVGADAALVGYFYAADLQYLTETEAEIETAVLASVRTEKGDKLPIAKFRAVPTPEPTAEPEGAYIRVDGANVRAEASAESEAVAQLAQGAPVTVLQAVQNDLGETWYLIAADGAEGYVRADLVANVSLEAPAPADEPEQSAEQPEETLTLAERIEETNPDRSIDVNVTWDSEEPALGSTATLTMAMNGYDGLTYTVFWQCDKGDGWETVHEGAPVISFMVCEENVNWQWRAGVTITAAATDEAPAEEPADATAAE